MNVFWSSYPNAEKSVHIAEWVIPIAVVFSRTMFHGVLGVTLAMWISLQGPEQRRNSANATCGSKLPIPSRVGRRAKAAWCFLEMNWLQYSESPIGAPRVTLGDLIQCHLHCAVIENIQIRERLNTQQRSESDRWTKLITYNRSQCARSSARKPSCTVRNLKHSTSNMHHDVRSELKGL